MRYGVLLAILIVGAVTVTARPPQETPKRKIPCKTPENASMCYWTRGRLQEYNGTPAYRLWKIGTKRVLGIYSGRGVNRKNSLDNEDPELPPNVRRAIQSGLVQVFGDFEVCPLEPERPGFMQAACIETGKDLFIQK